MKSYKYLAKRLAVLFENQEINLREHVTMTLLSERLGVKKKVLESFFESEMEYTLDEMVSAYSGEYQCLIISKTTNLG